MIHLFVWLEKGIRILAVIGGAYLTFFLSGRIFRGLLLRRLMPGGKDSRRWLETIVPLLQSLTKYVVAFFAIIFVLRELGVDATALLAGAGVVGLAVGFGAQTLVRDIVTGMFLLFEDTLSVGDVVEIGEVTGTVEEMTLRVIRVRLFSGALVTIPNGEIGKIANYNRGFTRAIVDMNVAYEVDLDRVVEVMKQVAEEYYQKNPQMVFEPPLIHRIVQLGSSSVVVRVSLKVCPQEHWSVERELRYLLKRAFDAEGIEIPYQKKTVYVKEI
ncbi:MAG: mechanosensitive ion channel family protein [Atribacterota bacterium]